MPRRVRDLGLETRAARGKLKACGKPYYKSIGDGLHLGYRKGATVGKWVVRRYIGDQDYKVETIATADDIEDADGTIILNFWQAQDRATSWWGVSLCRPLSCQRCRGGLPEDARGEGLEHDSGVVSRAISCQCWAMFW